LIVAKNQVSLIRAKKLFGTHIPTNVWVEKCAEDLSDSSFKKRDLCILYSFDDSDFDARTVILAREKFQIPLIVVSNKRKSYPGDPGVLSLVIDWNEINIRFIQKKVNAFVRSIKNAPTREHLIVNKTNGLSICNIYQVAVNGSKDGIINWNIKKKLITLNNRASELLNLSSVANTITTDEWYSFFEQKDEFRSTIEADVDKVNSFYETEQKILKISKWILIRGQFTILDYEQSGIHFVGTITDITVRKEMENELKQSYSDLKFALASEKILMEELDRKNKELLELSITDGLTGLYNHRFLQERFDFEFRRVRRYGGELSCLLIDIDHFKAVNDTYGHQFGDHVLRQISTIMKAKSRDVDICGRYGGEEFVIITNLKIENAFRYAAKLLTSIENHVFEYNKKEIHVTVSIGVAEYENEIKTKQELIERADNALYQAKKDGRNTIRLWKEVDPQVNKVVDNKGVKELKDKFENLSDLMRMTYMESVNALIKAVDAKDPLAKEHSRNVCDYSMKIAKFLKLTEPEIEIINYAAQLHDIGKISIKDDILNKKDDLAPDENELMKKHAEVGVNILKEIRFLEKEIPIILHHHERYDGKGYPHGLRGREIPLGARIIAVADAFDAMISGRSYKENIGWKKAVNEIRKGVGSQFSPEIVNAFLELEKNGEIRQPDDIDEGGNT
jgi:diguanylate cyclase (GGDEF)-like protein/putative nucleotidyltransferase with HDIG domain